MSLEQQAIITANIAVAPVTSTNYVGTASTTTTSTTTTTTATTSATNKTSAGLDELLQPIFYFPGVSSLVGSALSEGVYVAEKLRDLGLEGFDGGLSREGTGSGVSSDLVRSVKGQVTALTSDFRGLQSLLGKLPTFLTNDGAGNPSYHRSQDVDEPIHGEFYFPEIQKFENIKA